MRYVGQGYEIPVPVPADTMRGGAKALKAAFDAEYERVFGRAVSDVPAEVLTWRLRAMGPHPAADWAAAAGGDSDATKALKGNRPAYFHDTAKPVETPVFDRYRLGPGAALPGPAIVEERESTALVPPGARATVDANHNLVIELSV